MNRALIVLFLPLTSLGQVPTESLCSANEKTYFSCPTQSGKVISVCGAKALNAGTGYLQYRFGKFGLAPEFVHPKEQRHPAEFFEYALHGMGAKARVENLRFQVSQYTYVVFRYSGAFGPELAGVQVTRRSQKPIRIDCVPDDNSEPLKYITYVQDKYFFELQFAGLPEVPESEVVY